MAPETALKRLSDDGYNAHLQAHLTPLIALIGDAEVRIAEHAAHMAKLEKDAPPELHAVSRRLQHNLKEGLRLLMQQRGILLRELAPPPKPAAKEAYLKPHAPPASGDDADR
jgi:hypothetical protein